MDINEKEAKAKRLSEAVMDFMLEFEGGEGNIEEPIAGLALATVAGLMPIALKLGEGSEASAPLARAAVGGLVVSTVLTLLLVPCIYEFFYARMGD